ncbi:MAG: phage tail protein [Gracilibacteraceae bacterium]|jgi:phage tail-like protein|nr:phage tail protein [Gracilibacteraceae bacterium]
MADEQTQNSVSLYYPLTKMNFLVTVDSVSGVAAFNEVTGIDASVDIIEFRQGNANSLAPVKIQGLVKHGNLTLKMGYTRSQPFKDWINECVSERREKGTQRHNVTIELIDITTGAPSSIVTTTTGATAVIWILQDAWVSKYTGPDLNASTSEVAIESVEIAYEELTIPN